MNYLGDFSEDETIRIALTTNDGSGGAVAPSSAFEVSDFKIFKDGSATEKTSTNGLTISSPFDSITGLHKLEIDTSNDTGDAGFWAIGSDYWIVLSPDETVDSQTVVAVVATFSIENRNMVAAAPTAASVADAVWDEALSGHNLAGSTGKAIRQVKEGTITIEASIDDTSATTTSFVTNLTESTTSYYSNKIIVFISGSLSGQARIITNYNGTTKAITLEEPLTSAPADGDEFLILATHENSIGEIQAGLATSASIAALNDLSSADVTAAVPTAAQIRTEIDSNSTQLALLVDGQGYQLTILAGAISNAGTATEAFTFTYNSTDYAATYAGLDTSGNRGTTVLSKP